MLNTDPEVWTLFRPLKFLSEDEEVYLLVTALVDRRQGTVSLGLQPQNESLATLSVLEDPMGDIASPAVKFGVSQTSLDCGQP